MPRPTGVTPVASSTHSHDTAGAAAAARPEATAAVARGNRTGGRGGGGGDGDDDDDAGSTNAAVADDADVDADAAADGRVVFLEHYEVAPFYIDVSVSNVGSMARVESVWVAELLPVLEFFPLRFFGSVLALLPAAWHD